MRVVNITLISYECQGISFYDTKDFLFEYFLRLTKKKIKALCYWPFMGGVHNGQVDSLYQ